MNSAINSMPGQAAGTAAPAIASAAADQAPETVNGELPVLTGEQPAIVQATPFEQLIDIDAGLGDAGGEHDVAEQPVIAADGDQAVQSEADALLSAMTAPLTPAMMASNTPAALPAMMMAMQSLRGDPQGERNSLARTGAASLQATMASLTAAPTPIDAATGQTSTVNSTALGGIDAAALAGAANQPGTVRAGEPAASADAALDSRSASIALSGQRNDTPLPAATAAASQANTPAPADVRVASQPQGAVAERAAHAASNAASTDGETPVTAGVGASSGSAPTGAARSGDTLTLSGTPASWRQNLQEALGNRLQMQLGRGVEQATIRLEPPMLGRIDISIRHSAGSLEVNIAATHGEVLRQLNAVSDTLRGDLAGRQYTDVSVNVSQTSRTQASAQANNAFQSGADGQGRGSKPGDEQDERTPGKGLYEASQADTLFTLN